MGNFLSSCLGKPKEVNVNVNQSSVTKEGNNLLEKGKDLLNNITPRKSLESDQFEKKGKENGELKSKEDSIDYTSYANGAFYNLDDEYYFERMTPTVSNLTGKDSNFSYSADSSFSVGKFYIEKISPSLNENKNQSPIMDYPERIKEFNELEEDSENGIEYDSEYNNISDPVSGTTEDLTLSFTDSSESKMFVGSPEEGDRLKARKRLNELYKSYHKKD